MGKSKRAEKKARRQAKGTQAEAEFHAHDVAAARKRRVMRGFLWVWPPVIAVSGIVLYFVFGQSQVAGIVLLAGAVVWFPLWLGSLGSEVPPKDRGRAGGIDFGQGR